MEVSARGWARDSGPKSIMKADFRDGYHYPASLGKYGEGETYLKIRKNGEIDVSMGPNDLKLTGEYQVIVTLTKSESLTLFVESHKNDSLREVVKALYNASQLLMRRQAPTRTILPKRGKPVIPTLEDLE